jgi:4,5-DOPA dioxygenase extradiol
MHALPSFFFSQGSPMTALQPGAAGAFLQALGPAIEAACGRPKAIVVASAHTLTRVPTLLAAPRHVALYDFGGFDPALRQLRYDAPGSPALATRAAGLLRAAGMPVQMSREGGLDHGIWTLLRHLFPRADVPVLPLGWPPTWSARQLFALGQALNPLTDAGVWVLGMGSISPHWRHVLARRQSGLMLPIAAPEGTESAASNTDFRDWFANQSAAADWPALFDWPARAPHADLMDPSGERLLPFFFAAGAGQVGDASAGARVHASLGLGDIAMDVYAFGPWGQAHPF